MEQQRSGDVHLTSVDAGSSYQTFQYNTTLLGKDDNDHSGVALWSEPKSGSRIQLLSNGNSDSKVNNEEGEVSGTGAATSVAEAAPGLCLVHLSLIFASSIDKFGINFFLSAVGGALGAILNIFTNKLASFEVQLIIALIVFSTAASLSPWFNFVTYCALQFASTFSSGYINALGYTYIVRVWGDRGYLRGAALQLFTLMYTLGIVVAPLIIEHFLVTLPSNVNTETCGDVSVSTVAHWTNLNVTSDDNNVKQDAMTSTQQQLTVSLTSANNEITRGLLNSTTLSHQQDVGLSRWAFSLGSFGNIVTIFLLAVICLMSQQTFASSNSRSDNNKDAASKLTASVALVCAMFATIFFWASLAGSFTLFLQTYAIVGLGWDKSDASYLNTICAAGQVIGRLVSILLSSYISRRPALLSIVVLLAAGVSGLLLMMAGDLWSAVQGVVMRIGVFVAGAAFGPILALIFLVVDEDHHLDVFKSAILVCGEGVGYVFVTIFAGFLLCGYGSISFIVTLLACSALFGISLAALTYLSIKQTG